MDSTMPKANETHEAFGMPQNSLVLARSSGGGRQVHSSADELHR